MGQGGKTSLANTTDADILEYILSKMVARIAGKTRTFLVKVKAHRGEPLNEGEDDLAESGHTLEREGENYRWKQRTTRLVFSYYDRISSQWKKDTWSRTIRNAARRGVTESLLEERLELGGNKWRKGLFVFLVKGWRKITLSLNKAGESPRQISGMRYPLGIGFRRQRGTGW